MLTSNTKHVEQEAADGEIELRGDDARMVDAMLHFMYTFEYDSRSQGKYEAAEDMHRWALKLMRRC